MGTPRAKKDSSRPKIEEDVRDTIIRIRKETGFGYTKILQELRRMGVHVSRQTVKNVIVAAGLEPTPGDHPDTWHKFIKRHADTLWQCDFASKKKWTMKGLVDVYFLVFIHISTRQIWISPCTENPTGGWTTQQGRNFQMHLEDNKLTCEILMRDRDRKYVDSFDEIVRSTGGKIKLTPIRSPNLQAHVERVIQTIKHEVLNAFCIVSNQHLDGILRTTQDWYNKRRGHAERDHLPPIREETVTANKGTANKGTEHFLEGNTESLELLFVFVGRLPWPKWRTSTQALASREAGWSNLGRSECARRQTPNDRPSRKRVSGKRQQKSLIV